MKKMNRKAIKSVSTFLFLSIFLMLNSCKKEVKKSSKKE
jgi:hypothetical protein